MIKIGTDIVFVTRMSKLTPAAAKKIFLPSELRSASNERLAGIFALKECCKKIFGPRQVGWHDILVTRRNGKPVIKLPQQLQKSVSALDCSVAHDGGFAVAVVVVQR